MSVALELALLPDVERLVSVWLREDADVVALVDDRVFTAWPKADPARSEQALVLVTRIGGEPPFSRPLVFDLCTLQLDCYSATKPDRKHGAHALAETVRRSLSKLVDQVRPEGVVHDVTFGAKRYIADESFDPPRSRYVCDVDVTTSPNQPTSGLERRE